MRVKTLILAELFLERRDALETSFDPDPFQDNSQADWALSKNVLSLQHIKKKHLLHQRILAKSKIRLYKKVSV